MSAVIDNVIDISQDSMDGFLLFGTGEEGDANIILPGATSDSIFTSAFLASDDQIDAGFLEDVINAGAGDDTVIGGNGDDVLSGGAGADAFIFEFFGNEQSDAILDFSLTENDEIRFIDEDDNELTVSNSFFVNNGIGDGEVSVEIDSEGNLSINGENVDDDDFELL